MSRSTPSDDHPYYHPLGELPLHLHTLAYGANLFHLDPAVAGNVRHRCMPDNLALPSHWNLEASQSH